MPRKTFVANEILTAGDVNSFLMNQSVMTFAGTAARGSAIGTATEGMLTYLEDLNKYQYFETTWKDLIPVGTNATVATGTTAYTATAANANGIIYSTSASAVTITIPDVLTTVGDTIDIIRDGAGTVTIAAGSGVTSWAGLGTLGTATTFKIDQQYNAATVIEVAPQTYRVIGKISL